MTRSTIRRRALKGWDAAGLTPITPHEARHTFGSMLAAAGVDAGERQRQMGHASSAMMDRYTHGIDGSVAEAGASFRRGSTGSMEGQRGDDPRGDPRGTVVGQSAPPASVPERS